MRARKAPDVVVIGCSLLDYKRYEDNGKLLGPVPGGIGRNIAENLARLGIEVGFVTLASAGPAASLIFDPLRRLGVRIAAKTVDRGIGKFVATLDHKGGLVGSRADLPPAELLDWSFLARHAAWLQGAHFLVAEAGLEARFIHSALDVAQSWGVVSVGLPTRLRISAPRLDLLGRFDWVLLNGPEAEVISHGQVHDVPTALLALERLQVLGLGQSVITLGPSGVVAHSEGLSRSWSAPPAAVVDATGAGDAFCAGFVCGLMRRAELADAIALGLSCAARTTETIATVAGDPVSTPA